MRLGRKLAVGVAEEADDKPAVPRAEEAHAQRAMKERDGDEEGEQCQVSPGPVTIG